MKPIIAVPAILALVYRAWSRKSLTPLGIVVAAATAVVHTIHPWSIFFALLTVFFLGGTTVTKVKHDVKARLTNSSSGSPGGEGPRTHVQVLANSLPASILILLHWRQLSLRDQGSEASSSCWSWRGDILVAGIIANYAAVAADTFSSELGILSKTPPRLITSITLRKVPPGTNGGVTVFGLLAGLLGAFSIAFTTVFLLPFCDSNSASSISSLIGYSGHPGFQGGNSWTVKEKVALTIAVTIWGGLGSVLDSLLGGWLQASVIDVRSGKIIEGDGGKRVLVSGPGSMHTKQLAEVQQETLTGSVLDGTKPAASRQNARTPGTKASKTSTIVETEIISEKPPSRKVETGHDILDNNGVNLLMATVMSVGGILAASWYWDVPLETIIQ